MGVHEVHDSDEFKKYTSEVSNDKWVVVDFSAKWCGPCRRISPKFVEFSNDPKFSHIVFIKVDVDELEDAVAACEISAMPTFQFFRNGKKVKQFLGADADKLLETLNSCDV